MEPPAPVNGTLFYMKWIRRGIYPLFLTLCLGLGIALHFLSKIIGSFQDPGTSITDVFNSIKNPRSLFAKQDRLTILLVGQDYNHTNKGYTYSKASRADTVMIMSVDLANASLRACSIPRDTLVVAPDRKTGKINATFSRGGIDLLKRTLQERFDITIDHHIIIKPDAVREIVDSVGGIEVEAIDEMNYDDNWGGLHIHLPAGKQVVDGKGAEGFVRFREVNRTQMTSSGKIVPLNNVKSSKEEGDLRRTARQQQLLHGLIKSASTSSNLMQADKIIGVGFEQIETDLSKVQCLALASIMKGSASQSMVSSTVPGTNQKRDGLYYFVLDEEKAKATVDWLIKGDEGAMKKTLRVEVFNGTKTQGAAAKAAKFLVSKGYSVTVSGNGPPTTVTKVVYRKAAFEGIAKQIQQIFGASSITKDVVNVGTGPDISITVGDDLSKTIQGMS